MILSLEFSKKETSVIDEKIIDFNLYESAAKDIEEELSYDNAVNYENDVNSTSVNVIENGDDIEDSSADSMSDSFSDEEKETIEHDNDDTMTL